VPHAAPHRRQPLSEPQGPRPVPDVVPGTGREQSCSDLEERRGARERPKTGIHPLYGVEVPLFADETDHLTETCTDVAGIVLDQPPVVPARVGVPLPTQQRVREVEPRAP